jgi:tRNA C32,U32 (ribose-2'-O)-methylase TrmJ
MDYLDQVEIVRHANWDAFEAWRSGATARLILFTTRARRSYLEHAFRRGDVLLFGRETSGVPEKVHAAADARLVIPMREGLRSLNVALAAAMCRSVEQPVLVSEAFANVAGMRRRLVSVGRYALRGVAQPQELFTLDSATK